MAIAWFIVLFFTHAAALWTGWYFGVRVHNPHLTLPTTKKTEPPQETADIYDEERLDFE